MLYIAVHSLGSLQCCHNYNMAPKFLMEYVQNTRDLDFDGSFGGATMTLGGQREVDGEWAGLSRKVYREAPQ